MARTQRDLRAQALTSVPKQAIATILLVDDERQVTAGLALVLRKHPYEILSAHSGREALAVLARKSVAVVVSDEQMPGMSGSEFLRIVSRDFPETAKIMLTGKASVETAIAAINDGKVTRFLRKPCKPDELASAIAEALQASMVTVATSRILEVARREGGRVTSSEPTSARVQPPSRGTNFRFGTIDPELIGTLSIREREVLELLADGLRVSQIAKGLFVSQHTVRNHLKAIFQKLDIHSQAELLEKCRGTSA